MNGEVGEGEPVSPTPRRPRLERARAHRHRTRPSTEQRRPPHSSVAPPGHARTPPILPGRVADSPPITIRLCRSGTVRGSSPSCSWRRIRRLSPGIGYSRGLHDTRGLLTWYQTASASSRPPGFGSGLRPSSASCEEQL